MVIIDWKLTVVRHTRRCPFAFTSEPETMPGSGRRAQTPITAFSVLPRIRGRRLKSPAPSQTALADRTDGAPSWPLFLVGPATGQSIRFCLTDEQSRRVRARPRGNEVGA